ncbi:hypothetical protein B8V81_4160 [Paenibacillus pasadenensis]|uniref:Uncharacterized protein n=1 Tax=Paenibacillus pasadenensis TaxID=217090 RepID=A0A2N5N610_9BACL|nr:hypothetical protein B8V81_4160 [Paenibacillus pasadenensis]
MPGRRSPASPLAVLYGFTVPGRHGMLGSIQHVRRCEGKRQNPAAPQRAVSIGWERLRRQPSAPVPERPARSRTAPSVTRAPSGTALPSKFKVVPRKQQLSSFRGRKLFLFPPRPRHFCRAREEQHDER